MRRFGRATYTRKPRSKVRRSRQSRCRRHRRRGRHRAADRHLRSWRSAAAEAVPRRRASPVRRPRQRADLLSPHLHRRSRRGVPPVRRVAGRGRPHVHPGGRRGDHAGRPGGADRSRSRRARRCELTCRCGRSGLPGRSVRRLRAASASSRRSIVGAWTSSRRAARSTSPARAPRSAMPRRSVCVKASGGRSNGTRQRGGYERWKGGSRVQGSKVLKVPVSPGAGRTPLEPRTPNP